MLVTALFLLTDCASNVPDEEPAAQEGETIELAVYMGRLQLFSDKLYWAGKAKNEQLVDFYLHEMEEAMEEIHESNLIDEGVDISAMISSYGLAAIERMEDVELDSASFETGYSQLIQNCNACHAASNYSFVRIIVPTRPAFTNQDMTP